MNIRTYVPDNEDCAQLARKIFIETSGIMKEGRKYQRMQKDAFNIRKVIEDRIQLQSIYLFSDDVVMHGREAEIAGKIFYCSAFEQIDPGAVKGVYLYAAAAGRFDYPDDPVMNQLYADIWGSAFTDAIRIMLKQEIEKETLLSDSFGPGFYGMDVTSMDTIDELLDFSRIDVKLHNNRILVPMKACAGMYFAVDETYEKLDEACLACMGNHASCRLCQAHRM